MRAFAKCFNPRPLALFSILYALGVYASHWVDQTSFFIIIFILITGAFFFILLKRMPLCIFLLALLVGFIFGFQSIVSQPSYHPPQQKVSFSGRVGETPETGKTTWDAQRTRLVLNDVKTSTGETLGNIWLDVYGEINAQYGDMVFTETRIKVIKTNGNPNGFDYRIYAKNRGISFMASVNSEYCVVQKGHADLYGFLLDTRKYLENDIQKISPDSGAAINGILLGLKDTMNEEDINTFQTTGLSHVLSVSGLHVGFIVTALYFVLKKLKKPKVLLIIPVILLLYCAITAFPASIVRASIMGTMMVIATVWGHRNDPVTSLSLAMFLILLVSPLQAFDVGFQMSFSAAYGIILLSSQIDNGMKRVKWLPKSIRSLTAVSLSAQIAVTPVSLLYFNQLYPYSLLSNLLFVPLFGIIVIVAFLGMVLGAIWIPLGIPFGFACDLIMWPIMQGMRLIEALPGAALLVPSPPVWSIGVVFLLIVICSKFFLVKTFIKRNLCFLMIGLSILPFIFASALHFDGLQIRILDVGQGNCTIIETPDKKTYIVDTGPDSTAKEYLLKNGISTVDGVILTHLQDDHAGGLAVLTSDINVNHFIIPAGPENIIIEMLGSKTNQNMLSVKAGDRIEMGEYVSMEVLSCYGKDKNIAMALRLNYKTFSMLFATGLDGSSEEKLAKLAQKCDVLNVGNHGSKRSAMEGLLGVVQPRIAVISVGINNGYGNPEANTLQRLQAAGASIYRTDTDGMITLKVKDGQVAVGKYLQ